MKPTLKRLQTTSPDRIPYVVDTIQANTAKIVDQLAQSGITDSVLSPQVVIAVNDTTINHGLSRPLRGWIVIGKTGLGDIFESETKNPAPEKTIIFRSSLEVAAKFLFF